MTLPFRNPSRALVLTIAVTAGSALVHGAAAAASGPFLAHQALYDLSLVKSRGSNSVSDARGRILYNFSGSSCEGYTSEFRQVSELDSGEGKVTLSDLRSTSWEDAAGKSYRFKIDTRMNDSESSPVDGIAELRAAVVDAMQTTLVTEHVDALVRAVPVLLDGAAQRVEDAINSRQVSAGQAE